MNFIKKYSLFDIYGYRYLRYLLSKIIMDHLAIMNPKWKLIPKILSWEKKIESRRYMIKGAPRNKIQAWDIVYFKDAGKEVTASATVAKVLQFDNYTDEQLHEILNTYADAIAFHSLLDEVYLRAKPKKYCILIFLKHPKKITPFAIDKTWYGSACAWITVNDIKNIQFPNNWHFSDIKT